MIQKQTTKKKQVRQKLPPDFDEFVKWVHQLPLSYGVKKTIITGVRRAYLRGLTSLNDVKSLPRKTRGYKSMKYGMSKYEEFKRKASSQKKKRNA